MAGLYEEYSLGIDLGTTYSCVSIYRDNKVEIIPNEINERTTPSIVTFLDNGIIKAGEEAWIHEINNSKNTVHSIKRLIGRFYDDELKSEIEKSNWSFVVVKENSRPKIKIDNHTKLYLPEEISQFVLEKLIKSAEKYLGKKVNQAVITVPHNFTEEQRKATEEAAKLAKIKVLRILSEPTAGALAYGLEKKIGNKKLSLSNNSENLIFVFDLGGGTFDITLLKISENSNNDIFDVIASSGYNFLGGDDFDNILFNYCIEIFCDKWSIDKNEILNDTNKKKLLKKNVRVGKNY